MPSLRRLLPWVERLTGIEPARVERAVRAACDWDSKSLPRRITEPRTIDDAVRTFMLADAVETLTARGVPKSKLLAKLKDLAQFEATWAELRCAAVVVRSVDADVDVEMETRTGDGKRPDLRLVIPEGPPHSSVEIKSVGLADVELAFIRRMSATLDRVIPSLGMVTLHAPLDGQPPHWTPELATRTRFDAARAAATVPGYPAGMTAATIVAHGSEDVYIRRVAHVVTRAIRQLPAEDDCWVALHWGNGAPIDRVADELDWSLLPNHVKGISFVGSVVVFPHRNVDVFIVGIPRGFRPGNGMVTDSTMDEQFAELVLERTEASSGVRATLVRGTVQGKSRQLLRRNGTERISPFNLILDRDPAEFRR